MKKRIIFLLVIMLFATGCTCEYTLTIDDNYNFYEETVITAENDTELNSFNNSWQIPINKEDYNIGLDSDSKDNYEGEIYNYKLIGDDLKLDYNFKYNDYPNSSAVSNCYNKLTVTSVSDNILISTSQKAICFENNPTLTALTVKINITKPVINNNADTVNGSTYIWYINNENYTNKPINLVIDNSSYTEESDITNKPSINPGSSQENNNGNNNEQTKPDEEIKEKEYTLYIFLGVLFIIVLICYIWFTKIKNKSERMDV